MVNIILILTTVLFAAFIVTAFIAIAQIKQKKADIARVELENRILTVQNLKINNYIYDLYEAEGQIDRIEKIGLNQVKNTASVATRKQSSHIYNTEVDFLEYA